MNTLEMEASRAGISPKEEIREQLIRLRTELMKDASPDWDRILIYTHAIWWLSH